MSVALQDVLATLVATSAMFVLIRRVVRIARPSKNVTACGGCAQCSTAPPPLIQLMTAADLTGAAHAKGPKRVPR